MTSSATLPAPPDRRAFDWFRRIAILEGASWLLLLFIAMPLKYGAGWELGVRWVGRAHGGLFILYLFSLAHCWWRYRWSLKLVLLAGLASLVPGGPFWLDHKLPRPA